MLLISIHLRSGPPRAWVLLLLFFAGITGGPAVADPDADWASEAIFYAVYVRSFSDSDGDGDGDLPGLTARLDYIASLGANALLLMPVQQSDYDVYGGYAVRDFMKIEERYGGDEAWQSFLNEARQHGFKVVLDLSLTHVADTHEWFVAARQSTNHAHRSRFVWAGPPCPSGKTVFGSDAWTPTPDGPCYYSTYHPTVPAINVHDASTADALLEIGAYWLRNGVDGYRLDSAPHLGEVDPERPTEQEPGNAMTHAFWRRFMTAMNAVRPGFVAVAEVVGNEPQALAAYYEDGIGMLFDYPVYFALLNAWTTGKAADLASVVEEALDAYPAGRLGGLFLGNHDVPGEMISPFGRIADVLGEDAARRTSAAMLLFSLPGTPFVYYGEEIGLGGAPPPRESAAARWSRNPMQWAGGGGRGFTTGEPWAPFSADPANVDAQDGESGSLLETYRGLARIRRQSAALTRGAYRQVPSGNPGVYAFLRESPEERILVLVNLVGRDAKVEVDLARMGFQRAGVKDRVSDTPFADLTPRNAAAYPLSVPAYAGRWLRLNFLPGK